MVMRGAPLARKARMDETSILPAGSFAVPLTFWRSRRGLWPSAETTVMATVNGTVL
jgi:hypothetical protein